MKLSIIIINYKTYLLTKQTIQSILNQNLTFNYEIILVDNYSNDGSIEQIENDFLNVNHLKIIRNPENGGFSKGNNVGLKEATGEFILLLNSDTSLGKNTLLRCIKYIENKNFKFNKKIGALGCKVVLEDGTLDHACKRGFPTPKASFYYLVGLDKKNPKKYGQYKATYLDENEIGEVDCLTGAFMLMPKEVLDKVGFLDEQFFMYGEDIDLCFRIKEAGYRIVYYPKVETVHFKGGSSKKQKNIMIYHFHNAMWLFYKKHYKNRESFLITQMVKLGISLRYTLVLLKNLMR
ncbi:MAG: glycosyl transferase family 2 [Epulopiscium sp. Nele67-Bin005]|nr:MAG: glycosyl transferase family 2 [Epulopiscium sp. Nele67-Bin005]